MSSYCITCNHFADYADGRCSRCGGRAPAASAAGYFVSGPGDQASLAPDLAPGTSLERFTVVRRLGGQNGIAVYQARDTVRGEDVALKLAFVGPDSCTKATWRLQREMQLHAQIADHRHVIRAYDLHFVPWGGSGLLALSMEFADGGSLREWLVAHRADLPGRRAEGLNFVKQACAGLGALHAAGLLHLDVKPENLVFTGGVLKVSDLGAATCLGDSQNDADAPSRVGTPAYMSPQQFMAARSVDLDQRADIYSLGIVLYEVLESDGRRPFSGGPERLRELHLRTPAPVLKEVSPELAGAVARCLSKNPADRLHDVAALVDELEGRGSASLVTDESERRWGNIHELLTHRDFNGAQRLCRQVLESDPHHTEAKRLLDELQAHYAEAEQVYAAVAQDMEQRALHELIALVRQAIEIYPEHPAGLLVKARLAAKAREYREKMRAGAEALSRGYWETARDHLERARQVDPDAPHVTEAIEDIVQLISHRASVRGHIEQAILAGKKRRALSLARTLDQYLGEVQAGFQRRPPAGARR